MNTASNTPEAWITRSVAYTAVYSWYREDKVHALSSNEKELLSQISKYVVKKHRTRGFIMNESYLHHAGIRNLIDARVLHLLQTGRQFPSTGCYDMAILVLDFGTYSSFLRFGEEISFFTRDFFEQHIVQKSTEGVYGGRKKYPFDQSRSFYVCDFDPLLSPSICPLFSEFDFEE